MPKPIENNDNAKQFWGHLADATALEAATKGLLRDVLGAEPVVKSANFTAENGETYHVTATATVTDPAAPVEGKGFSVHVIAGTVTVGGVAYTTGVIIRTYISGAWSSRVLGLISDINLAYILTALGITTYADLATANAALAIGKIYYDTALATLNVTTA
jgi:hypothetical protein